MNMTSDVQRYMSEHCSPAFNVQVQEVEEFFNLLNKIKKSYSGNQPVFKYIVDLLIRIHLEPDTKKDNYEQILLKSKLIQMMSDKPLLGLQLVNYIDCVQQSPTHALHSTPLNLGDIYQYVGDRCTTLKDRSTTPSTSALVKKNSPVTEFLFSRNVYKRAPSSLNDVVYTNEESKIEQLKKKIADLQKKLKDVAVQKKKCADTCGARVSAAVTSGNDRSEEENLGSVPSAGTHLTESETESDDDSLIIVDDEFDEAETTTENVQHLAQQSYVPPSTSYRQDSDTVVSIPANKGTQIEQDGMVLSDVGKNCIMVSVKNTNNCSSIAPSVSIPFTAMSDVTEGLSKESGMAVQNKRRRKQTTPTIKISSLISKRKAFEKSLNISALANEEKRRDRKQKAESKKFLVKSDSDLRPVIRKTQKQNEKSSGGKATQKERNCKKFTESTNKLDRVFYSSQPLAVIFSKKSRLEQIISKLHSAKKS